MGGLDIEKRSVISMPFPSITDPIKPYLYGAIAIVFLAAFAGSNWFSYTTGKTVARADCADEKEDQREADLKESGRQAAEFQKHAKKLEGELNEIKKSGPVIRYVPRGVCDGTKPDVPAAARNADAEDATRQAADLGAALAHDADHYPECVARLSALIEAEEKRNLPQ